MMYFTFRETLTALLSASALGFFAGIVYECLRRLTADLTLFPALCVGAWKSALIRDREAHETVISKIAKKEPGGIRREICGFVFTCLFGLSFLLLTYLTYDGVVRLFMIGATLLSFALFEKSLGIPARRIAAAVELWICRLLFFTLRLVFFLPRLTLRFLWRRAATPLFCGIRHLSLSVQSRKREKRIVRLWHKSLRLYK